MGVAWGRLYGCFDVNDTWDILLQKILCECNLMCPVTDFYIRKDHSPWFNNDILELAANRDALYKMKDVVVRTKVYFLRLGNLRTWSNIVWLILRISIF